MKGGTDLRPTTSQNSKLARILQPTSHSRFESANPIQPL
jgi:hypothetical protein